MYLTKYERLLDWSFLPLPLPFPFLLILRSLRIIADIKPIRGINKTDPKRFVAWAQENFQLGSFK